MILIRFDFDSKGFFTEINVLWYFFFSLMGPPPGGPCGSLSGGEAGRASLWGGRGPGPGAQPLEAGLRDSAWGFGWGIGLRLGFLGFLRFSAWISVSFRFDFGFGFDLA